VVSRPVVVSQISHSDLGAQTVAFTGLRFSFAALAALLAAFLLLAVAQPSEGLG